MSKKKMTHKQLGEFICELFVNWVESEQENVDKSYSIFLREFGSTEELVNAGITRENLRLILEEIPHVYVYLIYRYCFINFSNDDARAIFGSLIEGLTIKSLKKYSKSLNEYHAAWLGKTPLKIKIQKEDVKYTECGGNGTGNPLRRISMLASQRAFGELNASLAMWLTACAGGFSEYLDESTKQTKLKYHL